MISITICDDEPGTCSDIENIILLASKDAKNHRSSLLDLKIMIDEYKFEKIIHNCNTEKELLEIIQNIKINN